MYSEEPLGEDKKLLPLEARNRAFRRKFTRMGMTIVGTNKPYVLSEGERAQKLLKSKRRLKHAIRLAPNYDELIATN